MTDQKLPPTLAAIKEKWWMDFAENMLDEPSFTTSASDWEQHWNKMFSALASAWAKEFKRLNELANDKYAQEQRLLGELAVKDARIKELEEQMEKWNWIGAENEDKAERLKKENEQLKTQLKAIGALDELKKAVEKA
jgi:hypothetical protein